jgi:DNA-binding MarR family transcriptional regulator
MKKAKFAPEQFEYGHIDLSPSHLLHRVLQIALDIYTTEVGEGALTQRQFALLKALEPTQGLSQSELVKITGIDRSTMADLVARMLVKGHLEREKSVVDARANLVKASLAGRTALVEMKPKVMIADEKILMLLSPPKRESFVKLLRKIVINREEALGGGTEEIVKPKKVLKKPKSQKKANKQVTKQADKLRKLPMPQSNNGAEPESKS